MTFNVLMVTASIILAVAAQTALPFPPKIPATYPDIDQNVMISGAFLTEPSILEAIAYVKAVVPAATLSIPVSTFLPANPSSPTYKADVVANCYWPSNQCLRTADTATYKADISQCPNKNDWGLTYDDGPTVDASAGTSQLLTSLKTANLKSTFFIVGSNAVQFPSVVKSIDTEGHELALHSWSHHPMTSLTNEQIVAELKYNEAIIFSATGKSPLNFRPPYGDIDDRVRAIVAALGFRTVLWTFDSGDTGSNPATSAPAEIKTFFTSQAGFITLQHDISPVTTKIALNALKIMTGIATKPQPVAMCQGLAPTAWYKGGAGASVPSNPGANNGSANGSTTITPGTSPVAKSSAMFDFSISRFIAAASVALILSAL